MRPKLALLAQIGMLGMSPTCWSGCLGGEITQRFTLQYYRFFLAIFAQKSPNRITVISETAVLELRDDADDHNTAQEGEGVSFLDLRGGPDQPSPQPAIM